MSRATWQFKENENGKSTRAMVYGDLVWLVQYPTDSPFDSNSIHISAKKLRKILKRNK